MSSYKADVAELERNLATIAVEVANRINGADISRSRQSADTLAAMFGEDALSVVVGRRIDPADRQRAETAGVRYISLVSGDRRARALLPRVPGAAQRAGVLRHSVSSVVVEEASSRCLSARSAPWSIPVADSISDHGAPARNTFSITSIHTRTHFIVRNSWRQRWGDGGFAYASDAYAASAFDDAYGAVL